LADICIEPSPDGRLARDRSVLSLTVQRIDPLRDQFSRIEADAVLELSLTACRRDGESSSNCKREKDQAKAKNNRADANANRNVKLQQVTRS